MQLFSVQLFSYIAIIHVYLLRDSYPHLTAIPMTSYLPLAHFHSSTSTDNTFTSFVKENSANPSPSISEKKKTWSQGQIEYFVAMKCVLTYTNDLGTKILIITLKYTQKLPIHMLLGIQGHTPAAEVGQQPHISNSTIHPKPRTRRNPVLMKR